MLIQVDKNMLINPDGVNRVEFVEETGKLRFFMTAGLTESKAFESREKAFSWIKREWPDNVVMAIENPGCGKGGSTEDIMDAISVEFDCEKEAIEGRKRTKHVMIARAAFVFVIRHCKKGLSFPEIGEILGRRDHTTIVQLNKSAKKLYNTDDQFKGKVRRIVERYLVDGQQRDAAFK